MLVVLDDLHRRFAGVDCSKAWERLADATAPALTFDYVDIGALGLSDELYIKMNSRGKALTAFENFKAALEAMVAPVSADLHRQICERIDNEWTDIFWRLRGSSNEIDERFLRYFLFVSDAIALRSGRKARASETTADHAKALFSESAANAEKNLATLVDAFDIWTGRDVLAFFRQTFVDNVHEDGKVAIFGDPQLFDACCISYGSTGFPLARVVLLFAVVRHLASKTAEFAPRIRVIRNLVENSALEQRLLPTQLDSVEHLLRDGVRTGASGFSQRQIAEERAKHARVTEDPTVAAPMRRLEDHPLLRGCLAAFDIGDARFARRAETFLELFCEAGGVPSSDVRVALLACGDYLGRRQDRRFEVGTSSRERWREEFFTGAFVTQLRPVLAALLDAVGTEHGTPAERARAVTARYLAEQEAKHEFDWRYYIVKYPEMRTGAKGIYAPATRRMSFDLCMLRTTRMYGWFEDPFLTAIYERSGRVASPKAPQFKEQYPHEERWLDCGRGLGLRCTDRGLHLRRPTDSALAAAVDAIAAAHGASAEGIVPVPQSSRGEDVFDTTDRIQIGVALVKDIRAVLHSNAPAAVAQEGGQ